MWDRVMPGSRNPDRVEVALDVAGREVAARGAERRFTAGRKLAGYRGSWVPKSSRNGPSRAQGPEGAIPAGRRVETGDPARPRRGT